jgi:hypothetical protein
VEKVPCPVKYVARRKIRCGRSKPDDGAREHDSSDRQFERHEMTWHRLREKSAAIEAHRQREKQGDELASRLWSDRMNQYHESEPQDDADEK